MNSEPKTERNRQICDMYVNGATLQACGDHFKISRERVRQLLRKANVFKRQRAQSTRDQFLGVGVPQPLKDAVELEAERQETSVSALVAETLEEAIKHE
jgi:predicted HicB family RNase H-like nuclease